MVGKNMKAFLDTIAFSELGAKILKESDNGYNVIVGSLPGRLITFSDYKDHPRKLVALPKLGISSTAAGRYQQLARNYDFYKKALKLSDFSPASQDVIAIRQIQECKAVPAIEAGDFKTACALCCRIWASLPGAGYGQHENSLSVLQSVFDAARK